MLRIRKQKIGIHSPVSNGIVTITLNSWKEFFDYIEHLTEYPTYIFRGQEKEEWDLTPSLFRDYRDMTSDKIASIREKHLARFVAATRGRRGSNPAEIKNENLWWALGQHHGLKTPLLDWTESPFVALYFAFKKANIKVKDLCVVYGLSEYGINRKSDELKKLHGYKVAENKIEDKTFDKDSLLGFLAFGGDQSLKIEPAPPNLVEIVRPLSDENARLVSQRGLFVRSPDTITLEDWIKTHFHGDDKHILKKIRIPNEDKDKCLRYLNKMNINHLSLFPDLSGASEYCNTHLDIKKY